MNMGDSVKVVNYEPYNGKIGVITIDPNEGYDFAVEFPDGEQFAFNRDEIELVSERGFKVCNGFININLPKRQTKNSAGYDFEVSADTLIPPGEIRLVPTGVKAYMGTNEYLALHIRSSLAGKRSLTLANNTGIVDSDYFENPDNDGHIQFLVLNFGLEPQFIAKGERIGQGIFCEYLKADNDECLSVRKGGFGSTNE